MFGAKKAADVHNITEQLTAMIGIEKERLMLDWISSAEATKFAKVAQAFTATIRKLGPSSIKKVIKVSDNQVEDVK